MDGLAFPVPLWVWAAVTVGICVMLAVDLLAHRDNHVIGFTDRFRMSLAAGLVLGDLGRQCVRSAC